MNSKPLTVLFLSTGNAARSIMAEAILRARGDRRFIARSAGFKPELGVHPQTLSLLSENGFLTDNLHTKSYAEFLAASLIVKIDVIVTLSEHAREACPMLWPGDPVRGHWPVDDPLSAEKADVREWKFRKCLSTLDSRMTALMRARRAQSASELQLQLRDIGMVV